MVTGRSVVSDTMVVAMVTTVDASVGVVCVMGGAVVVRVVTGCVGGGVEGELCDISSDFS